MNNLFNLNKPAPSILQIQAEQERAKSTRLKKCVLVGIYGVVLLGFSLGALFLMSGKEGVIPKLMVFVVGVGGSLILLSIFVAGATMFTNFFTDDRLEDAIPEEINDLADRDLPDYAVEYIRSVAAQGRVITGAEYELLLWAKKPKDSTQDPMAKLLAKHL